MENKILKSPIPAYFLIVCLKSRTKNKPFKPIQFTQHLQTIVNKQAEMGEEHYFIQHS